jgi:anti-sigma B factor antagonist
VGDVTVVTAIGRIVAGEESRSLQACLDRLLRQAPHVLLHLGGVEFIDSGGLGLIARYLTRAQDGQGTLNVCAVSAKMDDVLRITRLKSVFQPYETEADSIVDLHSGGYRQDASLDSPDVLCVDESPDVLTYLRELLKEAGHRALTAANLPDALILLKATHPKIVIISAELRATDTGTAEEFNRLANAGAVVELPPGFSRQDAGEAAQHVLQAVHAGSPISGGSP